VSNLIPALPRRAAQTGHGHTPGAAAAASLHGWEGHLGLKAGSRTFTAGDDGHFKKPVNPMA